MKKHYIPSIKIVALCIAFILLVFALMHFTRRVYLYYFPYGVSQAYQSYSADDVFVFQSSCIKEAEKRAENELNDNEQSNVSYFCGSDCKSFGFQSCQKGVLGTCTSDGCALRETAGVDIFDIEVEHDYTPWQ